jgi:hypothetical protein
LEVGACHPCYWTEAASRVVRESRRDLAREAPARDGNNAWANHRLHEACAKLNADDYKATRTSFFPSIHLTLNHILLVDWYYLDALDNGAGASFPPSATSPARPSRICGASRRRPIAG